MLPFAYKNSLQHNREGVGGANRLEGSAAGSRRREASRAGEAASGTSVTSAAPDRLPRPRQACHAATGSAVPPKPPQPATAAARNGATSCAGVAGCPPRRADAASAGAGRAGKSGRASGRAPRGADAASRGAGRAGGASPSPGPGLAQATTAHPAAAVVTTNMEAASNFTKTKHARLAIGSLVHATPRTSLWLPGADAITTSPFVARRACRRGERRVKPPSRTRRLRARLRYRASSVAGAYSPGARPRAARCRVRAAGRPGPRC